MTSPTASVCFVDTETTGLDPERHEIWEVALILQEVTDVARTAAWCEGAGLDPLMYPLTADKNPLVLVPTLVWSEHVWQLPVDLGQADPYALQLTHYYDRATTLRQIDPSRFARYFEMYTRGLHLVGNVVSFDAERLRRLLQANGACPAWHYHLVDCEALVAGKLGLTPPWRSDDLSRMIHVDPPGPGELHTALGDARWAKRLYEAVFDNPYPTPTTEDPK
jgi:hypothetical protein